jgi:methyl-accepting chemotaxis protein
MDRTKLRRKVILDLLSTPWTVVPTVAGASSLMVAWAAEVGGGWLTFAGIAGLLAGVGSLATQFIFNVEEATRRASEALAAEAQQEHEDKLDALDARLKKDKDHRDERSLQELRELYRRFRQDAAWASNLAQRSALEIGNKVEKLFQGCIISLERSLALAEAARKMNTSAGRQRLLDSREKLLDEVRQSIDQLAKTLDGVKSLAVDQHANDHLAQIRRELDESLEVARRVEQRMQSLEEELGPRTVEPMQE